MKIHQSDSLDYTPALALALKGAVEILERGLGPSRLSFTGNCSVIWTQNTMTKTPHPTSCIVYCEDKPNNRIWIFLSYTLPGFRESGLHKALFKNLEKIAKEKGLKFIESGVHPENHEMIAAVKSQGRIVRAIEFAKEVK